MAFPTTPVIDNFNRANATPPSASWAAATSPGLGIVSNQLAAGGSNYQASLWVAATYDNPEVYLTWSVTSIFLEISAVNSGTGSGYGVAFEPDTDEILFIRWDSNVRNVIDTVPATFANGDVVGIRLNSGVIEAYQNGTLIGSWADATHAMTGLSPLIAMWGGSGDRADNFGAGNFVENNLTLAATDPLDTAAASATVEWLLHLGATEPDDTLAGSLQAEVLVELAATDSPDTAAGTAVVEWRLVLAATEPLDTALFDLGDENLLTLAATDPSDSIVVSGTVEWDLQLAATESLDTLASSLVTEWEARLAATETPDVLAMLGSLEGLLTLSGQETPDSASITMDIEGAGPIITPTALWLRVNGVIISARRERIRVWLG